MRIRLGCRSFSLVWGRELEGGKEDMFLGMGCIYGWERFVIYCSFLRELYIMMETKL